jgi:hypothetical protein
MSKGWHGGNRIKSKKASAEDQVCLLCGQDDSQAHWLHHCPHPPSAMLRSEAFKEINDHIGASANPRYGTAFRTVLMTTTDPERIWTSNWSLLQIQHLGALLESAQVLPKSACGLSALASEVLLLSRILSRTALQLWIVKTSIESPILRRRRIAAAEAADDAVNPTMPLPQTDVQPTPTEDPDPAPISAPVTTLTARPQPYVHSQETIGGHTSKRRRAGTEPTRPSPVHGVLSIPTLDPDSQAADRAFITRHTRDTVVRLPNTRSSLGGILHIQRRPTGPRSRRVCGFPMHTCLIRTIPNRPYHPLDTHRFLQMSGYRFHAPHRIFPRTCPCISAPSILHL